MAMEANSYEARTVSHELAREEVVIGLAGKPVMRLVPVEARKPPRVLGRFAGMHVPDEAMAPLTDEEGEPLQVIFLPDSQVPAWGGFLDSQRRPSVRQTIANCDNLILVSAAVPCRQAIA